MNKKLLYISIIILTSCYTTKSDQFYSKLIQQEYEIINSERVNRKIFYQELSGNKYTFKYKDSIQIACYDVSRAEYIGCNSIIDITNFDILTNSNFNESSIDNLYTDYIEQQLKQNIPEDEIEFTIEHVPVGIKKVDVGLLSMDEHEIILITSEQLISIMFNEDSTCKISGILDQFYTKELHHILGIDRNELKWIKI